MDPVDASIPRPQLTFAPAGVDAILMRFGRTMNSCLPDFLYQLRSQILSELSPTVLEVVPAYSSLLVYYEPRLASCHDLQRALTLLSEATPWACSPWSAGSDQHGVVIRVPVCYDPCVAPDLLTVAKATQLSIDQVIEYHLSTVYQVYALGFAPGFAYLGSLPEALQVPRLAEPRVYVPAGSVGIAEAQTAVYPHASPGGWHLIGRSAFRWFACENTPMTPVQVGDSIQFYQVDYAEFKRLWQENYGGLPE